MRSGPSKWNVPKFWRLRGKAADGVTVTLGRYATELEAQTDSERFARGGAYRNLVVQALEVKPVTE